MTWDLTVSYSPLLIAPYQIVISDFQIPSVIFALFLGPWSDQAGRKLLIMFPYLGFLLVCLSMIVNVHFFHELYVEFLWLENLSAFFGSYVIFLIGCRDAKSWRYWRYISAIFLAGANFGLQTFCQEDILSDFF